MAKERFIVTDVSYTHVTNGASRVRGIVQVLVSKVRRILYHDIYAYV